MPTGNCNTCIKRKRDRQAEVHLLRYRSASSVYYYYGFIFAATSEAQEALITHSQDTTYPLTSAAGNFACILAAEYFFGQLGGVVAVRNFYNYYQGT